MTPAGAAVAVRPLAHADIEAALPLFAGYQRFYRATPDEARNRDFFARLLDPSERGLLLGAWIGEELAGFAGLYWTMSSVSATDVVLMNDLFVAEGFRGAGVARALVDAAAGIARERRASVLRWFTEQENTDAQALYDRTGAGRSAWFEYELRTSAGG